jgi:5-methylcytosine-specific restriction endonuclease McrA
MLIPFPTIDRDAIHRKVREKYLCAHATTEVRKKIASNGNTLIRPQCLTCGKMIGAAIKRETLTPAAFAGLSRWDDKVQSSHWSAYNEELQRAETRAFTAALAEARANYEAYRETEPWKKKCGLVMQRASNLCEGCRAARATEVHHLTYDHCGDEFLWELVAICRPCHDRFHGGKEHFPFGTPPTTEPEAPPPDDDLEEGEDVPW